jgi:hypothetical protein
MIALAPETPGGVRRYFRCRTRTMGLQNMNPVLLTFLKITAVVTIGIVLLLLALVVLKIVIAAAIIAAVVIAVLFVYSLFRRRARLPVIR